MSASCEQKRQFCWGHITIAAEHGSRGFIKYPQCSPQKNFGLLRYVVADLKDWCREET